MKHFRYFAKNLLYWKVRFTLALVLAAISAIGLGIGLLSLGPALALILNPESGKSLIDLATDYNNSSQLLVVPENLISILPEGRFEGVLFVLIGIAALTIVGGLANFLHQYFSAWLAVNVIAKVRIAAFNHVLFMPLNRVSRLGSSEFVSRIVRDAEALQVGLLVLLGKAVSQFTKGVAAFIVACVFDYRLVVIAILVLPILAFTLHKIGRRVNKGTKASLSAQQELLKISSESVQGLRAVKLNTAEGNAQERFNEENTKVIKAELKVRIMRALGSPLMETLAVLVLGTLAAIAARSIIDGSLQFDRFLLSIGSLAVAGGALRPLASLVTEIQAAEAPSMRLLELLKSPLEKTPIQHSLSGHSKSIIFDNVTFTYENAVSPAIKSLSIAIQSGERVAIVGPNGSGKTTLISLLPRLLEPDSGSIRIDNVPIANVDLPELRNLFGVVTQETVLFQGSIASNISFGTDATIEQIITAAKHAHADDFINSIDGGYESIIYEQGKSLSGGQRQRLAIARVLLRNPSILIFDEATSQIDAESESLISNTLNEYCKSKTVLVIAHRMSTVQSADRILVLDQGQLVGNGSHEELLSTCDVYQRLTETQLTAASTDA